MAETMPEELARRLLLGSRDTYSVTVDGLGTFQCRRRSFFDDARIEVEAQEYLLGLGVKDLRNVLPSLEGYARMWGTCKVSVAKGPDGWRMDDGVSMADLARLWGAIEDEESRFRNPAGAVGEADAAGAAPSGAGVGVQDVPPAAFKRGDRRVDH